MKRRGGASSTLTLLTDFGTADGYVGAMKGVIATLAPAARVVDITHEIAPGDVLGGALALEAAARFFPPGTVHVAVVDPGVGTARRAIAVESAGQVFVGPDNGLLALAAGAPRRVFALDRVRYHLPDVSATFHGRDVFAPVAARIAGGAPIARLGTRLDELAGLTLPAVRHARRALTGSVIHADRFGNLVTNITAQDLERLAGACGLGRVCVRVAGRAVPGGLARTYGDRRRGALLALFGSSGRLEIARRDGSAAAVLRYQRKRPLAVRCVLADRG